MSKKSSASQSKKSLYRELTLGLICLVSIAVIAVNLISYAYLSLQAKQLYEQKSTEYSSYLHDALEWPLWNVDNELVAQIAGAFTANTEISALIVRDESEQPVYKKIKSIENLPTERIIITHNGEKIGSVELGLNLTTYREGNRQLLWTSVATMVLVIVVLFIATRWLLRSLLRKPIATLIKATGNIAEENYQQDDFSTAYAEFSSILSSFHGMSKVVAMRENSLRQINLRLEDEINERKQTEQALQIKTAELTQFFNVSIDLLCIANLEGIFLRLNPAWEKTLGFSMSELVGRKFFEFVHPDDLEKTYQAVAQLALHQEVGNFVNRYRCKNGNYRWIEWRSAPSNDLIYAAARDITDHIQTEEQLRCYKDHLEEQVQERTIELRLSRDAAEAANKAKSIFLANMSHELRTPLNAILGFSNIMRKAPDLPEKQRENIDIINRSGEHLLTLINDVLEMAKIEAGRMQLENKPFDLGNLVRDVIDMMFIRASEKNLQLVLDQSSDFPRYIQGDEAKLRQILVNLVGNAIKFTHQGGVTVRLGTRQNSILHLIIEVEDSGVGISFDAQQHIFEPFVQVGEQVANIQGTGLGLTITRQFVQLMSGTISVSSTPGTGSIFRVELPLLAATAADISLPEHIEHGDVIGLEAEQPQYRLLIVEDQKENQLLLAKLMETLGLPVKIAENGEQGVQLFQSWQPHLIWMDRRMPAMDGMEATRQIRQLPHGKEVKIIAVTASAFTEQRAEMLANGMDDFVRKPYRANEIYDCLSRQLNLKYIYANATPIAETEATLTPDMLTALPVELRQQLYNAIESLDSEQIEAVIAQVASLNATLSEQLQRLANNYDYPTILMALEQA
jgi:PAS domain S-box-containing protein